MVCICLGVIDSHKRNRWAADGYGLGESGQGIQHRIIFITRRKRKFGTPTNGYLHGFRLLARIVEQVVSIIFSRQGNGHRKTVGVFEGTLLAVFISRFMALSKVFCSLSSGPLERGRELIFMDDSWGGGSRKSKTSVLQANDWCKK